MQKRTSSGGRGWTLSSGTWSGSLTTTPATVTPLQTSVTSWRGSTLSGSSSPSGTLSAAASVLRSLTTTPERERCGTYRLTSSSGSPTTSPAWTGRSRKAPPPTGCGITSPKRASSREPAGSPRSPARQAEGASPRSHHTTPRHRHPTIERTTANAFFHMTRRRGNKPIFTRTPVDMSSETARVSRGVPSISKSDTSWKKRPAFVTFSHVPVTG